MNELPTEKRRFVGPLIAVLLLLGVAAYPIYWFTLRGGTSPERIHVVVSGEPAGFANTLRGRLVRQLTQVGFEVMGIEEGVDAPTGLDWDAALASADDIGARYLVYVEVGQDSERRGLTEGLTFVVATGSVRVGPVDVNEAEPGEARSLTFGAEGPGTDDALGETTEGFATTFRHWAAGDLLTMPALVARLEDPEHVGDAERQNSLDDALEKKAGQTRSLERFQEVCLESIVQLTIDDERGPAPFDCIEPSCGERYLFDLSADGSEALMHVEAPTFFVPFATSPAPRAAETVERLELAPLDGEGEPRVLAVAENFFGYGGMSDDDSRVTFVEQASQRFGVVALDVESTERRVLSVVERPGLVIQSRISPDGQWVLWHQKAFNRAHTELHLMPFEGGEEAILSRRTRLGRWVETPLRPGEEPRLAIIFDGTESYEGSPRPVLVDPAAPTDVVELDIGERVIRQVVGAHEGKLILLGAERDNIDACILGVRDTTTGEIEWKPLGVCIEDVRLSDRGEVVGAAVLSREGDPETTDAEAIVMDIESGDTTIHTINRARERYVRAIGDRIVFERGIQSQFPAVHPNAVCWTTR